MAGDTLIDVVDSNELTIQVLRGIQAGIAQVNAQLATHGERLGSLEQHAIATNRALGKLHDDATLTNETLGVIRERLGFAEAAAAAASDARIRLDERVDRVEARLDQVESRIGIDD